MPTLNKPSDKIDYGMDPKVLNNSQYVLKDIIQGDTSAFKNIEGLDMDKIQIALNFLLKNDGLDNKQKADLLQDSWRINYRTKPPTPEEFITPQYLGPAAESTHPWVKKVFLEFMNPAQPYRNLILYPHIGWGKLLAYGEKVYTPDGYIKIEDIQLNDKVCTPNGETANVIGIKDFPNKKIYKIETTDKRISYAGGEHFWKAAYNYKTINGQKYPNWKIITSEEILKDINNHPSHKWFLPVTSPVNFSKKEHIIDPYSLGALLGDGYFGKQVKIVGNDKEVFDNCTFSKYTFYDNSKNTKYSTKYSLVLKSSIETQEINNLGLANTRSNTKFIPKDYIYDSIENRICLLQGLMDTDGCCTIRKNGSVESSYWTISRQLSDDIEELVRSLGGFTYKSIRIRKGIKNYVISISFTDHLFELFRIQRKNIKYIKGFEYKNKSRRKYVYIKSIIETDKTGGKCIETDDKERLFLTNNFIVTHNSYLSAVTTLYISTCLNLMRDPWKYFGLNVATQLSQLLVSYSLKKSSELLLEPFLSLLEASPFFERCQRMDQMKEAEEDYKHRENLDKLYWTTAYKTSALGFSSGSTIKIASSPNGLLGLSIVSIVYSELAFFTDAGKSSDYIMRLYNDGKARVRSRLETKQIDKETGNKIVDYYGRTILDSSPNDLNNAIDDYIVNKSKDDKTNYLVEGSRWKWRPDEYKQDWETGNIFKVYLGGRGNPPRILEPNDPILDSDTADKNKIIEVPGSFRQTFKDDLKKALKDWAGIPTGSSNSLMYDYSPLEYMFSNQLKNIYLNIEAPSDMPPKDLIWNQIAPQFFKLRNGQYEYYYKPRIPRCVSVDQSYATDVTSISMSHVERLGDTGELIYIVDFSIPILPSKKVAINLEAIRCFIEDLKQKGHLRIEHVSFDQFQSEVTIQNLKREGFEVEKVSVDRSMDPYLNLISLINTRRIACGKNIFFKNNIKSLNIVRPKEAKGKTKIDHDNSREQVLTGDESWENSKIGLFGKDVSDSVCASIELCRLYYPVSEETWTGGPKKEDLDSKAEHREAANKTIELMAKLGLRI